MTEERSLKILLWLVAVGFFMQTLDATIVNTALPAMARSLGESPLRMQSVVVAYALTMAMLIPASGWLADRFGTRRTFFSAILLFSIGSLFCAMSQSLTQLVISRVIQGMGGAMLLPIGRLTVLRVFPREKFLAAMSFVTIPGLVGPLIGPALGGWLVEFASWHWIFLINIPIGIVGCIATFLYMPDTRGGAVTRFDLGGFVLLAGGMAAISVSLDGMSELGLRRGVVLVLLVFGLASITAYWLHASRREQPLFSLELFRQHTFSVGLLGNLFARLGAGCMPFLIPLLLQVSLGFSALEAGLMMIPAAAAGILSKRIVTPLVLRVGYRRMLVINTVLLGLAMASFAALSADGPAWLSIAQIALFGGLNSLQFTAMTTVTLRDLERDMASSGNSLLSMVMMLSMSMGVAIAGALLAAFSGMFGGADASVQTLRAFQATFICVGLITCAAAWIFWQLSPDVRARGEEKAPADME